MQDQKVFVFLAPCLIKLLKPTCQVKWVSLVVLKAEEKHASFVTDVKVFRDSLFEGVGELVRS